MDRSRRNKGDKSATRPKNKDYVIATVVEDMGKARDCRDLLEENDIPSLVREQDGAAGEACVAVLVPEEYLDEAHVVIESQDTYDDFYDLGADEEEDDDGDGDEYEDRAGEDGY